MIVIQQHLGGHFTPIHYPRQAFKTYISRQTKTIFELDQLEEFNIVFGTEFEFQIPFRTRIHKDLKKRYEYIVNKEQKYTLLLVPCVTIRFLYEEDHESKLFHDPHTVIWKDLIKLPGKLEYSMLNLLERVSFKKKKINKKPTKRSNIN